MMKTNLNSSLKRKTLIERAGEVIVRDPAAQARLQVSELDKTAKRSEIKRKACQDQINNDEKEIKSIDDQIALLKLRYDPLCLHLNEAKEKRKHLQSTLESTLEQEKNIMTNIKGIAHDRMISDFKLTRSTASLELQLSRGFSMDKSSTFYQKGRKEELPPYYTVRLRSKLP